MQYDFFIHSDKLICNKLFSPYTGNVNTYSCTFKINTSIKGLQWFCVFKQDNTAIAQPILNNTCTIPPEVLINKGIIEVGCYATNGKADDYKRLSTNWLTFSSNDGAYCEAAAPKVPSPDVWESLVLKTVPYIGENGNWFVYDMEQGEYVDTGVNASGSGGGGGITEETDPTVPEWAKQPEKPTYTASEVGALPDTTEIPSRVSELDNDSGYLTVDDVLTKAESVERLEEKANKSHTHTALEVKITQGDLTYFGNISDCLNYLYYNKADVTHTHESMASETYICDMSGVTEFSFPLMETHNNELRFKEVFGLSFVFGNGEYAQNYMSGLSFDSGATPTAIDYTDSGILNWVGTDCTTSNGLSIFQPSSNTHYDIVFYFNGTQFIGLVNGFVPANGNEAV